MQNNLIITNSIEPKEYNGEKVITFKDIDLVHKRPEGTSSRNYRTNKKYFVEGEDFFNIRGQELSEIKGSTKFVESKMTHITLITESGYLLLVKSFTDELSWQVQKMLIKTYFRAKEELPYKIKYTHYLGTPCTTVKQIAQAFHCGDSIIHDLRKSRLIKDVDYTYLMDDNLKTYKQENNITQVSCLYIFFAKGIEKIVKILNTMEFKIKNNIVKALEQDVQHVKKMLSDDILNSSPNLEKHIKSYLESSKIFNAIMHFRKTYELTETKKENLLLESKLVTQ